MKALILAAGFGSRLQHKTQSLPKALVQVAGLPVLQHQLGAVIQNGIQKFIVVLGYNGDKIIDFINQNYSGLDVQFVWNREYDKSNSSYSFWQARDFIKDEPYLHLNCDILFDLKLIQRLLASDHENVIAVRRDYPLANQMENVQVNEHGKIIKMSITNFPEATGKAFGLAKLGGQSTAFIISRLSEYLSLGDKNQNYYGIIREAVKNIDYYALEAGQDLLLEVNTLEDLVLAESVLEHKRKGTA